MALFLTMIMVKLCVFGQKYDANWVLGYGQKGIERFGNTIINFGPDSLHIYKSPVLEAQNEWAFTSVSDSSGNLKFVVDGCKIYNIKGEVMTNGDSLSFGEEWQIDCTKPFNGYFNSLKPFALPSSLQKNRYILFHSPFILFYSDSMRSVQTPIMLSIIDFNKDSLGEVIIKNKPIINGVFLVYGIVKKANGIGWWLAAQTKANKLKYDLYEIENDTIMNLVKSDVFDGINIKKTAGANIVENFDGSKLGFLNYDNIYKIKFFIYDFNRCTGKMSNQKYFEFPSAYSADGLIFSPSGRYLYFDSLEELYQMDLESPDGSFPIDTVAKYDGYKYKIWETYFGKMTLGLDGKIYISTYNSTWYYHTIENPNEKGVACNVKQHSIKLPTVNHGSGPYYPNYRMGPIDCDTVGTKYVNEKFDIKVFPNPVGNELSIGVFNISGVYTLKVHDLNGNQLYSTMIQAGEPLGKIVTEDWPSGMYIVRMINENGVGVVKKFVKE